MFGSARIIGRIAAAGAMVATTLATTLATAATPIAAAPPTRYIDPTFQVDVQKDVVYGQAVDVNGVSITLTLDVYTPRGDTATNRPVFIWAHGGFFAFGSKDGDTAWPTRMAQRGYVAASINYRLSDTLVSAPVDTPKEQQEIDDARIDMQTSVRWFKAHASSLRVDPDRIAVGGSSAGAITALGVAVNNDVDGAAPWPDVSSAVCTAVSLSGANDPQLVDAGDAGAIFHHGTDDTIVPFGQAVQTRDAMIGAGLAVQWNEYAGEGHGFGDDNFALVLARTYRWLYDRVATAAFPCSPAVARQPRLAPQSTTTVSGTADRSAVVSLIAVNGAVPGYVQALACGDAPGASSNLNIDAADQTRSTLAVVHFDAAGRLCIFSQPRTHLVVDLQGWLAPSAFDDTSDARILDTRLAGERPVDGAISVIHGRASSTAVASIVMTDTTGPGFVQVLDCGSTPGTTSNLNADAVGQTRSGLAFVRFDASGTACIYTQTAANLVIDVQGYMAAGSFDDMTDARALDTRSGPRLALGSTTVIHGLPGRTGVVSVVSTQNAAAGYVQVLACDATPGASSNLNADAPAQTVAGLAFVHFDAAGTACVFNQQPSHLVVDVQGYMAPGAFDDVVDVRLIDTRRR